MCDSCDYNTTNIYSNSLFVCKICRKSNPNKLITKSNASKEYILTSPDFDNVRHIEYRGVYTTYLYLIKDIEFIAIKKHGSLESVQNKIKLKEEKINNRQEELLRKKEFNKKHLDDYLKSIGLAGILEDSYLCQEYIEKGDHCKFSLNEIGVVLKEMNFFYNYTDYAKLLKNGRKELIQEIRSYDRYRFWNSSDEEELRIEIKDKALRDYMLKNYTNAHKILDEVPKSLKSKADYFYELIYNEKKRMEKRKIANLIENNKNVIYNCKKIIKEDHKNFGMLNKQLKTLFMKN